VPEPQSNGSYEPNKRTIGELLSVTSPKIIVPTWQRSYSWTTSQVEAFWTDLTSFMKLDRKHEYFLGSIVIVRTEDGSHLLLDGQQRLATSAILLSVIRDFLNRYKRDAAQRVQSRYLADFDDATETTTYKLTLNRYDGDFFRRFIMANRTEEAEVPPTPQIASHMLIAKARQYFETEFSKQYASLEPPAAYQWALVVQRTLTDKMTLIAITSSDEDSASEVFETLNDRGIGLSTPDLLRNLVMRRAKPNQHDEIVNLWDRVVSFQRDQTIKNFIRHFWISKYGDVKSQALYREIKEKIVGDNISSLTFSKQLRDAAELYSNILNASSEDRKCTELLQDIQSLGSGARILYPSVLAALDIASLADQVKILDALISVYVRHSTIGQRENSRLENVLYKATRDFRDSKSSKSFIGALSSAATSDDEFLADFAKASVIESQTQRYILRKLEALLRKTEELDVATASRVHVEHIYPQSPEVAYRRENHSDVLNRIGNLTLLSAKMNRTLQNAPYKDKHDTLKKSELEITKGIEKFAGEPVPLEWTLDMIDNRQVEFAKLALQVWKLPKS